MVAREVPADPHSIALESAVDDGDRANGIAADVLGELAYESTDAAAAHCKLHRPLSPTVPPNNQMLLRVSRTVLTRAAGVPENGLKRPQRIFSG